MNTTELNTINQSQLKAILEYKKCKEYKQYSNCLVTYLDHPSAIFIQIPHDGSMFQKMHQDMKRYYSNNPMATIFEIGDFFVAYSIQYLEFYRARIIQTNHTDQQSFQRKDPKTGLEHWNTNIGKQCTRKFRRLLIKPGGFVSITFLSNEKSWPLSFVNIKLDGQDIAKILHNDGFVRLTRNHQDLKKIYSDFGAHPDEYLIFDIQQPADHHSLLQ